jgi:hypothetical protein
VHAFPSVRIYRDRAPHSQENYMSDRTHQAIQAFVERNLPAGDGGRAPPFWEQPEIEVHGSRGQDGCIVSGSLLVNRVPGNFHISAHSGSHSLHMPALNLSHVVQHLSFGRALSLAEFAQLPPDVASAWNPLRGSSFVARAENVTIEHYLKVVHTTFERSAAASSHVSTYQHTVNSHQYEDHDAYPALVFSYELASVEVIVRRQQESLAAFLTQICAIVGGVFTVTGLVRGVAARARSRARPSQRAAPPRSRRAAPARVLARLSRRPALPCAPRRRAVSQVDSLVYHGDRIVRRKMEIGKSI